MVVSAEGNENTGEEFIREKQQSMDVMAPKTAEVLPIPVGVTTNMVDTAYGPGPSHQDVGRPPAEEVKWKGRLQETATPPPPEPRTAADEEGEI